MKLSELKKTAAPTPEEREDIEALDEAVKRLKEHPPEPQGVNATTPGGVEIRYEWAPRRLYRIRPTNILLEEQKLVQFEWQEVPSVTTVLGVLHKPSLPWWGMGVGVDGVIRLLEKRALTTYPVSMMEEYGGEYDALILPDGGAADKDIIIKLLTEHKLTVNHQLERASDRGVNVHGALEAWFHSGGDIPNPAKWPDNERGYVQGLCGFLAHIEDAWADPQAELMVGSLEHQYAGRFDLVLTLSKPVEVVTRCYPKRPPKIEEIPAGKYLLDLKTSKRVYDSHFLQLEAYEHAAVECGYEATDHRGVVHVTADGKYELVLNKDWTFDDFLAVRKCYQVLNEREVLRVLREELDAKEVA